MGGAAREGAFRNLRTRIPDLNVVAEDLGEVSDRVRDLIAFTGYPGMRVMCFGFDGDETNPHFPAHYSGAHGHLYRNP